MVQLLGACLGDRRQSAIIMELADGGNLAERVYAPHKRRLSYLEILQVGGCCCMARAGVCCSCRLALACASVYGTDGD